MHQRDVLFESEGITVFDFRCRDDCVRRGPEEPNATNSIAFVRRGLFERTDRGRAIIADANHALFFNAGQGYRYAHPVKGGDDCTILAIATPLALESVRHHAPADAERDRLPFVIGHAVTSRATARLHYEFLSAVRSATTLAIGDLVFELIDSVVGDAYAKPPAHVATARAMCEAIKEQISRRVAAPPTLKDLARIFACSPFTVSRTFHRTTGITLRAYLSRLRATTAAHYLCGGIDDLTSLALDLGYSDHSHFTNAFREQFGITPSQFRTRHRK